MSSGSIVVIVLFDVGVGWAVGSDAGAGLDSGESEDAGTSSAGAGEGVTSRVMGLSSGGGEEVAMTALEVPERLRFMFLGAIIRSRSLLRYLVSVILLQSR